MRGLLRSYMCNFIKPDVFNDVDDITTLDYLDPENQATNDELGIGTTTRLLLCGDLEDEVVGTSIERRFYKYVRSFYEASVSKILNKFPFKDDTIRELSFLDPRYRTKCTVNGIMHLSTRFTSFSTDEIDTLITEFQEYRIASDQQLSTFNYKECAAVDHFWAAMAEVRCLWNIFSIACFQDWLKYCWYYHIPMLILKGYSAWSERFVLITGRV